MEETKRGIESKKVKCYGRYGYFEANQVVHYMYEQTNHVLDHQSNSNMLQSALCILVVGGRS